MFLTNKKKRSNTLGAGDIDPNLVEKNDIQLKQQQQQNQQQLKHTQSYFIQNNQSVSFNSSKLPQQEGATEICLDQQLSNQSLSSLLDQANNINKLNNSNNHIKTTTSANDTTASLYNSLNNYRLFPISSQHNNNHNNIKNQKSFKSIFKSFSIFQKKKECDPKITEFIKMVDTHKEFFKKAPEIDKFVITLSYLYLKKAFPDEYITSDVFFYALYLAWETEEDSTLGLESIIHYVIGSYPSSKNKDKNQRKQEILEWRMRLRTFHNGKDILWKVLDYKTVIDFPQIQKASKVFPHHDILKRERTYSQSIKFF